MSSRTIQVYRDSLIKTSGVKFQGECVTCSFLMDPSPISRLKITCCNNCYKQYQGSFSGEESWNWKPKTKIKCLHCQELFYPLRGRKKHCSKECYTQSQIGKAQSLNTRIKRSLSLMGEKHPRWKGGLSRTKRLVEMGRLKYRIWRRSIFERDDYTCQICEERGGVLNAHHIKKYSDFKDLRFKNNNGITLCKSCHQLIYFKEVEWASYFNFNLETRGLLCH